ncbi:hypothetical protein [Leptospira haakeii]|uniref:Uncharacterized protein n=1 Tax=Leptospira haakeii TaxID=2023198 RepID=A0ABX4PM17_9LEPT|nr:hypothetical protein [Leptospira haakeii]PKA16675.1 hypothetical protein CH363_07865 [Leptospira haakeii]PKA20696.1 hypothetical protein CH377_07270 [Leptospira haakeii]
MGVLARRRKNGLKSFFALFAFCGGLLITSAHSHLDISEKGIFSKHSSKISSESCFVCIHSQINSGAEFVQAPRSEQPFLEYNEFIIFDLIPAQTSQSGNLRGRAPPYFS